MTIDLADTTLARAVPAEPGMPRLIGLGLAAAALFSVTFVLNRALSLAGGPWVWTAALRYIDMALLLIAWVLCRGGPVRLIALVRLFFRRPGYWCLAGGVGFGLFYSALCFAAGHAPGWVIAATWQSTILATPLVLRLFGARVPLHGLIFIGIIFAGIVVLNSHQVAAGVSLAEILAGVLPVLVAAFAYPFGNQMLNRARHAGDPVTAAGLADPVAGVLLLTLGSLPVFAVLLMMADPPAPGMGQLAGTAIVALIAGVLATTLFLHARNLSSDPLQIAAVDATQAGEVGFALAGEMAFLSAPMPDLYGWVGLLAVCGGLVGFSLAGLVRLRARRGE